jgi:SHAQKYF class myb-like DNA-binding protein
MERYCYYNYYQHTHSLPTSSSHSFVIVDGNLVNVSTQQPQQQQQPIITQVSEQRQQSHYNEQPQKQQEQVVQGDRLSTFTNTSWQYGTGIGNELFDAISNHGRNPFGSTLHFVNNLDYNDSTTVTSRMNFGANGFLTSFSNGKSHEGLFDAQHDPLLQQQTFSVPSFLHNIYPNITANNNKSLKMKYRKVDTSSPTISSKQYNSNQQMPSDRRIKKKLQITQENVPNQISNDAQEIIQKLTRIEPESSGSMNTNMGKDFVFKRFTFEPNNNKFKFVNIEHQKEGINDGAWTKREHELFLLGLNRFGHGHWRDIAEFYVKTRTRTQVASHAQKYFAKQRRTLKKMRLNDTDMSYSLVPLPSNSLTMHHNLHTEQVMPIIDHLTTEEQIKQTELKVSPLYISEESKQIEKFLLEEEEH